MMAEAIAADTITQLALIGNFLPRKCGLATFTTDIYKALRAAFPISRSTSMRWTIIPAVMTIRPR